MEARLNETPNAPNCKRPRQVVRPDVEEALVLWTKSMEAKGETYNGAMLQAKRVQFEELFEVPESERLKSGYWIQSFCKTYKIKQLKLHGEAGSVNLEALSNERIRVQEILKDYALEDIFNFDETGLFLFAPPDRGLSSKELKGKKMEKSRITVAVTCNAIGTEKRPLLFIGRAAKPRCFKKKTGEYYGFYYRNNKKAWMTQVIFEEWLKKWDIELSRTGRRICLTMDGFSAHYINYVPRNIHLVYFEPNLTSRIQPCDAGIIRCLKAHYRKSFCLRALQLDDAGEDNIYDINLLEAILMVQEAWTAVTATTIAHCWRHSGIVPNSQQTITQRSSPSEASQTEAPNNSDVLEQAWEILQEFAISETTLPDVEKHLQDLLGSSYIDSDWRPAIDAILAAEDDVLQALDALHALRKQRTSKTSSSDVPSTPSYPEQVQRLEEDLQKSLNELKERRLLRNPMAIEELLNPIEEQEIGEVPGVFENDDAIFEEVRRRQTGAQGGIQISEEDDEEDEDNGRKLTTREIVGLCQKLEAVCLEYGGAESSLELLRRLRMFRTELKREELKSAKQITLDKFFST